MRIPGHRDAGSTYPGDAGPIPYDSGASLPPPVTTADAGVALPDSGPPAPDAGTSTPPPPVDAGAPTPPPAPDAGPATPPTPPPSSAPAPIFGLTIDDPFSPSAALLSSLDRLVDGQGRRPTTRIVFDEHIDRITGSGENATTYVAPLTAIGGHARIMGELLDSYYVRNYSVSQMRSRACEYRATLGHLVDVWEIGNEVNGEWLLDSGEADTVVVDKIVAAAEVFEADASRFASLCPGYTARSDERPFEIALTAYGNGDATGASCWETRSHHMETWLQTHFGAGGRGAAVRDGIDYLFVSYYEDDCEDLQPDWPRIFDTLGNIFPAARLGFGECGTLSLPDRARYVQRYYAGMSSSDPALANMRITHPRYVGGFFWWYFSRDFSNAATLDALDATQGTSFWSR